MGTNGGTVIDACVDTPFLFWQDLLPVIDLLTRYVVLMSEQHNAIVCQVGLPLSICILTRICHAILSQFWSNAGPPSAMLPQT